MQALDQSGKCPLSHSPLQAPQDLEERAAHDANRLANPFETCTTAGWPTTTQGEVAAIIGPHSEKILTEKAWVDELSMNATQRSGQQTEQTVLSIWKRWLTAAIASGEVPDPVTLHISGAQAFGFENVMVFLSLAQIEAVEADKALRGSGEDILALSMARAHSSTLQPQPTRNRALTCPENGISDLNNNGR
ncbi:hypothetical protein BU15DRAFT_77091 [Melanogaster broomeanus]|nr:hypothetical protein BU15DRAFT_77091 [Melanogaster broomeanus]